MYDLIKSFILSPESVDDQLVHTTRMSGLTGFQSRPLPQRRSDWETLSQTPGTASSMLQGYQCTEKH